MSVNGRAHKSTFTVLKTGLPTTVELDLPDGKRPLCCFELPVLADVTTSDSFKNDVTSVYFGWSEIISSVTLKLYKNDVFLTNLNTGSLGTLYHYGFHQNGGKKYVGFQLNWKGILTSHGQGKYHVEANCNTITSAIHKEYSFTYCLKNYTKGNANKTVRIEFWHNGIIGNRLVDADLISFKGLNWYNSVRVPMALIRNERSEYVYEDIEYANGMLKEVRSEQVVLYDFEVSSVPNWLHRFLKIDVFQADKLVFTDYNSVNQLGLIVNKELKLKSNYEPNWIEMNERSSINLILTDRYNTFRKKFC